MQHILIWKKISISITKSECVYLNLSINKTNSKKLFSLWTFSYKAFFSVMLVKKKARALPNNEPQYFGIHRESSWFSKHTTLLMILLTHFSGASPIQSCEMFPDHVTLSPPFSVLLHILGEEATMKNRTCHMTQKKPFTSPSFGPISH